VIAPMTATMSQGRLKNFRIRFVSLFVSGWPCFHREGKVVASLDDELSY